MMAKSLTRWSRAAPAGAVATDVAAGVEVNKALALLVDQLVQNFIQRRARRGRLAEGQEAARVDDQLSKFVAARR